MKRHLPLLLLFFSITLISSRCKKANIELQLPQETTTGAMTFGCKIDGKIYLPYGGDGYPGIIVEYPFLGNGPGGGWFLNIATRDRSISSSRPGISVTTDSLLLEEGNTYQLRVQKGYATGEYFLGIISYKISANDAGTLTITKHDQSQRILSGRFSFTATNSNGDKVIVSDGRFDIRY